MVSKRYDFDDDTVLKIKTIKQAKEIKTEKEVLIRALDHYLLSEMIEHESVEFKTLQKMNEIEGQLKQLKSQMNHVDLGVSINNLFLTSDFEVNQYPKAIIDRDTLNSEYYLSAKREITKLIRDKDSRNRKENITEKVVNTMHEEPKNSVELKSKIDEDYDWLNI